jgi:hypothetical protein
MLRLAAIWLVLLSLAPALPAATGTPPWQQGEITSKRTLPYQKHSLSHRYLYRVRGPHGRYLVLSNQPLKLEPFAPMKFAVRHRHIFILDADGQECEATIIEKDRVAAVMP